ncbi:MAG TPA: type II toxin-antitoxin system HicB family antitoxin [Armatimonadota bacterium]|jgi:predicted RNase H-like HicB family nuclease
MNRTYTAVLRSEPEGGFTVFVPALRGCVTYGKDVPDALRAATEAIECYLLGLQDLGEKIPVEGKELTLLRSEMAGALLPFRVAVEIPQEVAEVA